MPGRRILAGNDYEFGMLAEKLGITEVELQKRVPITVMTRGEAGSLITVGDEKYEIPAAKCKKVVDPTGAGDAFRSGFVLGYKLKLPWPVVGRLAALTAVYAVEQHGPQQHAYTLPEFVARYHENFGASSEIDELASLARLRVVTEGPFRLVEIDRSRDPIGRRATPSPARSGADGCAGTTHVSTLVDHPRRSDRCAGGRSGSRVAIREYRKGLRPDRQRRGRADGRSGRQFCGYCASRWVRWLPAKTARPGSARARRGRSGSSSRRRGTRCRGSRSMSSIRWCIAETVPGWFWP